MTGWLLVPAVTGAAWAAMRWFKYAHRPWLADHYSGDTSDCGD